MSPRNEQGPRELLKNSRQQIMRSRIEPMKKIARSLRQHREFILNCHQEEFFGLPRELRGGPPRVERLQASNWYAERLC